MFITNYLSFNVSRKCNKYIHPYFILKLCDRMAASMMAIAAGMSELSSWRW
jgi:hypothetical protein